MRLHQKIDLHNHTRYSDGGLSAEELIRKKIDCGINVIGITDHIENIIKIDDYINEIHELAGKYSSSARIIAGVEIEFERQHIIIFGAQFIKNMLSGSDYTFPEYSGNDNYCVIVAHPIVVDLTDKLLKIAHGIEITFSGALHPEYSTIDMIAGQYNLFKIASSDTHKVEKTFDTCFEVDGVNIFSEEHVIRLFTDKKSKNKIFNVKYHVSDVNFLHR